VLGFVTGVGRIVREIFRPNGYGRMFYIKDPTRNVFSLLSREGLRRNGDMRQTQR